MTAEIAAQNAAWVAGLSRNDAVGDRTRRELFDFMLRAARTEARWRSAHLSLNGPELDDLAHQAASDAVITIVDKVGTFRGDCRFTTWAYRFAALIVGSKIRRHPWHRRIAALQAEDCMDLPARVGDEPEANFDARELQSVVRRIVAEELTPYQREVLVASTVEETSAEDLALRLGSNRNAIYKVLFDARQKVRRALCAEGFIEVSAATGHRRSASHHRNASGTGSALR
ncbi:sigma-70 family RNA polymerase sigma factor [Microlunatus sp. Gsoil 973]|uniref:sigma-70 family RNA polymerase sigma factor n=1 Tax=Microlunatus sp. Gsoil 973 TaxID=2672569 RepID=UPI0018A85277|nr:sigma-70 family RNA polymerase sigma factor [Microlunatus sp. Gsoil 973]